MDGKVGSYLRLKGKAIPTLGRARSAPAARFPKARLPSFLQHHLLRAGNIPAEIMLNLKISLRDLEALYLKIPVKTNGHCHTCVQ